VTTLNNAAYSITLRHSFKQFVALTVNFEIQPSFGAYVHYAIYNSDNVTAL